MYPDGEPSVDRGSFEQDIREVVAKHGMEGAIVSYRDGVSLVTLVMAGDPVWYAGFKVLGETFNGAANAAKDRMSEEMAKELARITAGN